MDIRVRLVLALGILLGVTAYGGQVRAATGDTATAEVGFPMFTQLKLRTDATEPAGMHDAVAAAILAVVWIDLGTNPSGTLILTKLVADRIDEHDWQFSGEGAVALSAADNERIGLRFKARFDGRLQTIDRPEIEFGGVAAGERMVPNDQAVIRQLEDELSLRFAKDFGEHSTRLQLDSISSVQAGRHLLRVTAEGMADFGISGTSKAHIESLYDLQENRWRKLDYRLSAGEDWQPQQQGARRLTALRYGAQP